MSDVRLEDKTICLDGEWLSADDLTRKIQEKMQSGDLKITKFAAALEELNTALENSQTLEVRLVISRQEYDKLRAFGGDDDNESVRKAITAFVSPSASPAASKQKKKKLIVKCPQCKNPIDVTTDDRPVLLECQHCGTSGRLTAQNRWARLDPS